MRPLLFTPKTSARAAVFGLIIMALSACGDPGSGGSGLPGSTGSGTVSSSPSASGALSSPVLIDALDASSVSVAGVRYALSQVDIVLSDGNSATSASLSVGLRVTITSLQDTLSQRWRLQILGAP